MKPETKGGRCPFCGEPNSYAVDYCQRCEYHLPWSDRDEAEIGKVPQNEPKPDGVLDEIIRNRGPHPKVGLNCRYCYQPIEVDTKRCPHCKERLVALPRRPASDGFATAYDDENAARVKGIGVQPGCFAILSMLIVTVLLWWQL